MFTSSTSQRLKNSNERDIFIKSISEAAILRLASEHHGSAPCSFFTPPSRNSHVAWGSFNVCYFIQVGCQDRCVVRIPLRPHLAIDPQAKIEFEIAAMKTVAASTTIPIAKIRAYSSSANKSPDPLSTYVILDFVDGRPLSTVLQDIEAKERPNKLGEIFEPLADILIQLRRLEFPSIGRLYCQSDGIKVHVGPMSIDMNEQELEGHQPLEIQASYYGYNSTLASTKAYTDMLLRLAYNTFANERAEQGTSAKMLYHLHLFSEYAKRWLDPDMENGPFVLFHGDLEPHNILVDPNMSIVAIMDWEWSRVVPAQFFLPPLWLEFSFQHLAIKAVYDIHMRTTFNRFLKTISAREAERYGNQLLTAEWSRHSENGGFLFAHALENFAGPDIDDMVYGYIHSKYYGGTKDLNDRIQAFLAEDDLRAYIIDVKERQSTTDGAIRRQNTSKNVELRSRSDPLFSLALSHSVFALAMGSFLAGVSLFIWKRIH